MKYTLGDWKAVLYWRLLRRSAVFQMWFVQFLTDLCYDLEMFDVDGERIIEKYVRMLRKEKK